MSLQQSQEGQPSVSTAIALPTPTTPSEQLTMLTVLTELFMSVMSFYCSNPTLEIKTTLLFLIKSIVYHMAIARDRPDDSEQVPKQFATLLVARDIIIQDVCYQNERVHAAIAAIGTLVNETPMRFGGSQVW